MGFNLTFMCLGVPYRRDLSHWRRRHVTTRRPISGGSDVLKRSPPVQARWSSTWRIMLLLLKRRPATMTTRRGTTAALQE